MQAAFIRFSQSRQDRRPIGPANYGPSVSAEVTLTVLDPVPTVTNAPVRAVVHVGETGNFQVGADGHVAIGYPLSYQWRFNGLDLAGQTSAALSVPNAQIANSGFYDVVVANMYGSVTSVVAVLDVLAPGVVPGAGAGLSGSYYNNPTYTEDAPPSPFDGAPALMERHAGAPECQERPRARIL